MSVCFWKPYWVLCITLCFFQKSQKSVVNKTFKNFGEASQNRDWAIAIRISFISSFVDGNDLGAGRVFRKDVIYKANSMKLCR